MEEKGIYLRLVDYRAIYGKTINPVIVNDFPNDTRTDRSELANLIRTSYDGDTLNILPTCDCTKHTGRYKAELGYICEVCNTPVVSHSEKPIEANVWLRAPEGVAPFMNPCAWKMITDTFTCKGLNIIQWLCGIQTTTNKPAQMAIIERLGDLGIKRGYNNFVYNFDSIIETLVSERMHRPDVKSRDEILDFIRMFRDRLFTYILPVPNKIAFITEVTAVGVYVDASMAPAMDAIQTIASIDEEPGGTSQSVKENRTAKTISLLADFYLQYVKKAIGPKDGWFRKHVFGTRITFSARAVISSISEPHRYDDLHTPWSLSISLLRIHIINKLLKRGYTAKTAEKAVVHASVVLLMNDKYSKDVSDCLDELLAESPYRGIPVILQRNPTLARASAQRLFITKIKRTLDDKTFSLSPQILAGPNADFDGDEMNLGLILDEYQFLLLDRLAPEYSVFDLQEARTISGINATPKPVISTIANWLNRLRMRSG